jgi:hypothetical protein
MTFRASARRIVQSRPVFYLTYAILVFVAVLCGFIVACLLVLAFLLVLASTV